MDNKTGVKKYDLTGVKGLETLNYLDEDWDSEGKEALVQSIRDKIQTDVPTELSDEERDFIIDVLDPDGIVRALLKPVE